MGVRTLRILPVADCPEEHLDGSFKDAATLCEANESPLMSLTVKQEGSVEQNAPDKRLEWNWPHLHPRH
jgi:hypothetical protein